MLLDSLDPDIAAHVPRILEIIAEFRPQPQDLMSQEASQQAVANLEDELARLATIKNALRAIKLTLQSQQQPSPTSQKQWN